MTDQLHGTVISPALLYPMQTDTVDGSEIFVNHSEYFPYQHSECRIFEPSFQQEQKSMLSEQCVQVLITASFQPLLRRHLRGEADGHNLIQLDDGSFQN